MTLNKEQEYMIDTHCHVDLFENPFQIADECEKLGIITIGMTNLPSHFEMGFDHLRTYKKVRLALGMHPLYANLHHNELPRFFRNISKTSYIGEIGLDFSKEGISTREIQLESFKKILAELKGEKKVISLHSRRAEKEVLEQLMFFDIKLAIFHWYSGPVSLINDIVKAGYYFSINTAMINSTLGRSIIANIPLSNLLTETDGPFITIAGRPAKPTDVGLVHEYLSTIYNMSQKAIESQIIINFKRIIVSLK